MDRRRYCTAMSRENVDVVRQIWEAADRRDAEAVLSFYDPEVDLDVSGFPVVATDASHYRGHEGLRRLFTEWGEIWSDAHSELEELIDAGDRVISVYSYRGRGRVSGLDVEEEFATVWTVEGGKAVRVQWFTGRAEALAAAGVRE
jgi:ketosteroid isomerase-like protein